MNALWTRLRRLVASVMLVAMASFVVHSGAMAGLHQHGPNSTECSRQSAAHGHNAPHDKGAVTAHLHSDGSAHGHAVAGHTHIKTDGGGEDGQRALGDTCCANVCAVALIALAPAAVSTPMAVAAGLLPVSQDGVSTHLDGLKRPPRTSDIA